MKHLLPNKLVLAFAILFTTPSHAFDHTHKSWSAILSKYVVKNGAASTVRYKALKEEARDFSEYLSSLSSVNNSEFNSFSADEKLAFLINAYNAFTLKLIIDRYPVKSIKDIGSIIKSSWRIKFFSFLGEKRHLDNLEHDMIRKWFTEPRIHFAVVCASIGCPALRSEAYQAIKLDTQLEEGALTFIGDPSRNRFFPEQRKLEISPIFKWYAEDFIKMAGSVEAFIASRITNNPELQKIISEKKVTLAFTNYDWSLNDAK